MLAVIFGLGIIMGSAGGILLKIGVTNLGAIEINSVQQALLFIFKLLTNYQAFLGLSLYFASGLLWSYLLMKLDISFVQPILSLTYVVTPLLAIIILNEHVSALRWLGIIIIMLGVAVVARSAA